MNFQTSSLHAELNKLSRKNSFSSFKECTCARILIVDDDSMCRGYLGNVVNLQGYRYAMAINGQEAVEYVENFIKRKCKKCKGQTLIIFMDIHMPVMNGIDATKKINKLILNSSYQINCNLYIVSGNIEGQYIKSLDNISVFKERYGKPIDKRSIRAILDKF